MKGCGSQGATVIELLLAIYFNFLLAWDHRIHFNLVVSTPALFSPPFSARSNTSCQNQMGVLVCATDTIARWGNLALFSRMLSHWSSLFRELMSV